MPKISQTQIGLIYLKEIRPGRWRASWTDPLTKRHVRRLLPVSNFEDARKEARNINADVSAGRGFEGRLRGSTGFTIFDAVQEAIGHTDANDATRRDYRYAYNPFAEYLAEHARGVEGWGDVSEQVLENFIEHCRRQKVTHDTFRKRLFVLRLTSAYMARTYPRQYRNVATGIRIKRQDPPRADIEAAQAILTPEQLRSLLGWLGTHDPMIYVWAVLQGLGGVRILEAAYARERDFDPNAGTLTITESSAHRPKNRPSYRTIPLCGKVCSVLSAWIDQLKVRHPEGYLFAPLTPRRRGRAKSLEAETGVFRADHISHLWTAALRRAKSAGVEVPAKFIARKLRASFVTAMREAGADFETLQRYIGHSPISILSAHYDALSVERLRSIASLAQGLFEGVGHFARDEEKAANTAE